MVVRSQSRGFLPDIYYSFCFPASLVLIGGNGPRMVESRNSDLPMNRADCYRVPLIARLFFRLVSS